MAIHERVTIIGGGLAGCEAAWQVASHGCAVRLIEMRPLRQTPAHQSDRLAELVCSNSLGSNLADRAPGMLKQELRRLDSLILRCADACAVPAGAALAVDRKAFSGAVTAAIEGHPLITVERREVTHLPIDGPTIVASGPLTSDALAAEIAARVGEQRLYFHDAMAPIVAADSIDRERVFSASRYGRGGDDYLNCPMHREQYEAFVDALVSAETIALRDFEREGRRYFEACLPIEVLAARGRDALAYGPLSPKGLRDPRTGRRPHAVVQLRQDDLAATLYNLVGFQTNLRQSEQRRVFGTIPGLERAEWVRYGQMHRNTYLHAPRLLDESLAWRGDQRLAFAGQLIGTEGYVASTAGGLVAGQNAARRLRGLPPLVYPQTTMLGALLYYVTHYPGGDFQPVKPNLGLLPPLDPPVRSKRARNAALAERALRDLETFIAAQSVLDGAHSEAACAAQ